MSEKENKPLEIDNMYLVRRYFQPKNVIIKEIGNRLIVTIKEPENTEVATILKKDLEQINPFKTVSIVFVRDYKDGEVKNDKWQIKGVKNIIAIASGKGGVGKSTTSVNLALALSNLKLRVALFDADIYGPSIPMMLGYDKMPPSSYDGETFQPFKECGIESMSIGSMIANDTALIWRGAKACGAIEQLLTQTAWEDIDIMIIDMPPGTGDIQITMSQKIDFSGVVIVSTPQDVALIDAVKGINLFNKIGVPILGVVENMSYYICEKCGHRADIFGHAGVEKTAERFGVDFLGEIPLHYDIRVNSDSGTPIVQSEPDSPYAEAYEKIAEKIAQKLKLK